MKKAYDVDQIRAAEAPLLAGLPQGTLMQRAARALARRCAQQLGQVYGSKVVVFVGAGNNGADALWAAAELARRGAAVEALLVAKPDEAASAALVAAGGRLMDAGADSDAELIGRADLVIDGLVGIGANGPLRQPHARLATLANEQAACVVAVDVPSGVDASTGEVAGVAVRADVTVTFGGWKIGLLVEPGASHAGTVDPVDIGLQLPAPSVVALEADDVAAVLPDPGAESDKYQRGVVGVVAGSDRFTGAAVLAVGGALAAGAGMVRYVGPERPATLVRERWPEAVVTIAAPGDVDSLNDAGKVQAWVCGPGLGTDEAAARITRAVCSSDVPVLLDADATTVISHDQDVVRSRRAPTVLTPHAGEFARLMSADRADVEAARLNAVRAAARQLGAVILLKGATTLVADADGSVRVNTAATPYLATAGTGDVLAGMCGALLAGGVSAVDAAAAGAFLHGLAGLLAAGDPPAPISASDVIRAVPRAVRAVRG
ncbi:MAG TPA: NAD(P)H-hydrate dehydratase [Mycobacteriales bacterium]|nr:NAD(P)H-hydrate dehydratase [Mycobacteriales bacterium]